MNFSLIIIGDEILSGHRQDKHFASLLAMFKTRGLVLSQVQYLSDDRERITRAMSQALHSGDVVFSCGGIGATPDDHTRQSVAAALSVELALHPEAEALITQHCISRGDTDMSTAQNQSRLNMGRFPLGASIIPNSYNRIPGFSVPSLHPSLGGRLYCLPGFPVMAWPMAQWVLDTHYAHLFQSQVEVAQAVRVFDVPESALVALMERIERDHAPLKAYSLPHVGNPAVSGDAGAPHIELGCKAPASHAEHLPHALQTLREAVLQLGGRIVEIAAVV
jgi:molybdopterin-biosynthesis enzyme MoeA-like protein